MLRFASSRRYFIWTWILIVSNTLFIQAKRCLPLSRCQEVQWIAEKQAELDISSKILNQISCGFEGGQPKVWCNVEGGIEDSSLYGTFQMLVQRPSQCIGQLKVYTAMENSLQIYNFRTGRSYGNLRNLNRIYRISSLGNCCWKMHLRPSFRGSGQKITAGFDDVPPFQFLSLKSTICWPMQTSNAMASWRLIKKLFVFFFKDIFEVVCFVGFPKFSACKIVNKTYQIDMKPDCIILQVGICWI